MKSRYLYPQGKHKAYSERITDFKGLLKKKLSESFKRQFGEFHFDATLLP